jgi:nucleotide-binding universal stress UspA family protein
MTETTSADPPRGPILLCAGTDAGAAARLAEAAAALLRHCPAVVLATWRPPPAMGGLDAAMDALYDVHADLRDAARRSAAQTAHAAADVLDAHGLHVTRQVCPEETAPWRMILDLAEEIDAAAIVAGAVEDTAHPPGFIGRQARAVAHRTHRPLLLLRPDAAAPGNHAPALFATDGSPPAARAAQIASTLLRPRPAIVASAWRPVGQAVGVAMVAVPDEVARDGAARVDEGARLRAARQALDGAERLADAGWPARSEALDATRNVSAAILAAADDHDAAVVVTGTRGRSRIAAALLGSTAESVLRHAGRAVLLVPPAAPAAAAGGAS